MMGGRIGTQARGRTGMVSQMGARLGTGAQGAGGATENRPMTAVRAAGYTSAGMRGKDVQYPFHALVNILFGLSMETLQSANECNTIFVGEPGLYVFRGILTKSIFLFILEYSDLVFFRCQL